MSKLSGRWLAFTLATPEERAKERFKEKFGLEPKEVHRDKGLLLVGPAPSDAGAEVAKGPDLGYN